MAFIIGENNERNQELLELGNFMKLKHRLLSFLLHFFYVNNADTGEA